MATSRDIFRGAPYPALIVLGSIVVLGVFAPLIEPHSPEAGRLSASLAPPVFEHGGTWTHVLGTDQQGRDILSRLIAGSRVSLFVGTAAVALAGSLGLMLALVGGYYGGIIDAVVGRLVDAMLSIPYILIAILLASLLRPGVTSVVLVIGLTSWASYARILRGEVLRIKTSDYVALAQVGGCSTLRILWRYVTPNLLNTFVVLATLQLGSTILAAATLSFLGIGVQPPHAEWGLMLTDGRQYITFAWWLVVFPGVAIMLTVLSANLLGDWLRARLDPRLRQAG